MPRPRVYLSGPLTKGDRSLNLCQFMRAHQILLEKGYAVMNPGLTSLIPWAWDVPHATWLEADLPWVEVADLVIRLPGESVGADMETDYAADRDIPVLRVPDVSSLENMNHARV